ncbi:MAG: hypothetical protein AAF682_23060 [Planctomycetota bacterium]
MIRFALSPRAALCLALALPSPAFAHVELLSPTGGEVLQAGTTAVIQWQVAVEHDTENWDLWYSTTGPAGPWVVVAADLPKGDVSTGALHSFAWAVPDTPSLDVRVRVRQDNSDADYEDVSLEAVTIVGTPATDCNANGVADVDELASGSATDFDGDGVIDACQPFRVDVGALSASAGGVQAMTLAAGAAFAGELYLVVGSSSGTAPGTPFEGLLLPLNFDSYSVTTAARANQTPFSQTLGSLDAAGGASAAFQAPAGLIEPSLAGTQLHHAFFTFDGVAVTSVSNAMPLLVLP